jgi:para-aminobenzoate synthetase component 1
LHVQDVVPLPYLADPCGYFARIRHRRGAVLLDSARPYSHEGRFDLLSSDPVAQVESRGGVTREWQAGRERTVSGSPFKVLATLLDELAPRGWQLPGEWPFTGGAIGWFGYGLGARLARTPQRDPGALPDLRVGIHGWALMQDHELRRTAAVFTPLVGHALRQEILRELGQAITPPEPFRTTSAFHSNMDRAAYACAFARIREYILSGDVYQVNFAQRLSADASGDPWEAYLRLRRRMASPFSAFMADGDTALLSLSPERFLRVSGGRVETRPIKGTVRRGNDPETDRARADALLASPKDRAENVMIVDLMRNDIGRACRTGSVHVGKLCSLESYANVHHLVSVVTGELSPDETPLSLLEHCFPGGSITGAPKIRAMQVIDELEPDARSIYCGSAGYISFDGNMDTSITIRSLAWDGRKIHAWGGGGIVADSACDTEYRESLTKVEPLLEELQPGAIAALLKDP